MINPKVMVNGSFLGSFISLARLAGYVKPLKAKKIAGMEAIIPQTGDI
jgi:hypothetical protein